MNKKIIFIDGDGTLWYPKKTKRTQKPHWIYHDAETKDNYLEHLDLTPKTRETLEIIRKKGIYLVVVSASPYAEDIAIKEVKEKLEYFKLTNLFYSVRSSSGSDPQGKAGIILDILEVLNLKKEDALMVGDSFYYDYMAAKDIGIDAFWIKNSVSKVPEIMPNNLQSIKELCEILKFID